MYHITNEMSTDFFNSVYIYYPLRLTFRTRLNKLEKVYAIELQ